MAKGKLLRRIAVLGGFYPLSCGILSGLHYLEGRPYHLSDVWDVALIPTVGIYIHSWLMWVTERHKPAA